MKRLEVIANQSVKEELIAALETALPGIQYTVLPMVHGKGGHKEKLGTRTWPETNFLIISYIYYFLDIKANHFKQCYCRFPVLLSYFSFYNNYCISDTLSEMKFCF